MYTYWPIICVMKIINVGYEFFEQINIRENKWKKLIINNHKTLFSLFGMIYIFTKNIKTW